jgi:hypothetical protein
LLHEQVHLRAILWRQGAGSLSMNSEDAGPRNRLEQLHLLDMLKSIVDPIVIVDFAAL